MTRERQLLGVIALCGLVIFVLLFVLYVSDTSTTALEAARQRNEVATLRAGATAQDVALATAHADGTSAAGRAVNAEATGTAIAISATTQAGSAGASSADATAASERAKDLEATIAVQGTEIAVAYGELATQQALPTMAISAPTQTSQPTVSSIPTRLPRSTTVPATQAAPTQLPTAIVIGTQAAQTGIWTIHVTRAWFEDSVIWQGERVSPQGVFLIVEMRIKNESNEAVQIPDDYLAVRDGNGAVSDADLGRAFWATQDSVPGFDSNDLLGSKAQPKKEYLLRVPFDVSRGSTDFTLQWTKFLLSQQSTRDRVRVDSQIAISVGRVDPIRPADVRFD